MEKITLSNDERKFFFININDTISRRISTQKQFDIGFKSKFISEGILSHDLVICYSKLGYALCSAKPQKEINRIKGQSKLRFIIIERFSTPIKIGYPDILKKPFMVIKFHDLPAELKLKIIHYTGNVERKRIEDKSDKKLFSQIGLAENITGGALVTFVVNWLYNIIRTDLNLEEIARLIGTLILGTIYAITYYIELKKISKEEIIKISSFDYILMIGNFFCVHCLMLFIKNASLCSWLIVILVMIDFFFIYHLVRRYKRSLAENNNVFILYKWWILSDGYLVLLLISICLFFAYSPKISALTNLGVFLLIFIMDEYVKRVLSKFYKY
jgi:hypothetical protein